MDSPLAHCEPKEIYSASCAPGLAFRGRTAHLHPAVFIFMNGSKAGLVERLQQTFSRLRDRILCGGGSFDPLGSYEHEAC